MTRPPTLVWFRRDLRLEDNAALDAASGGGSPIIPVYIHSPAEEKPWEPGAASCWWLHHSLERLDASLRKRHSRLVIRKGGSLRELTRLIEETGASAVYWNRLYEPALAARDKQLEEQLRRRGIEVRTFPGHLLWEPSLILNKQERPFQVFTPFWKHCSAIGDPPEPLPPPRLRLPERWPDGEALESLGLLPRIDWAGGLREAWTPGEDGGRERLDAFARETVRDYGETRNFPGTEGTSRLSPHLHFGEITPRQVWHAVRPGGGKASGRGEAASAWSWLRQIAWREFSHHLLHHFPHTPEEPLRENFRDFPWRRNSSRLKAWQQGRTGYPVVDAGMRELWATGWMHNRVRMIVASFLVKHLLIPWQDGARWFWDTLVDADLANNTMGWQWTAGCGADAAPFFRVFNPITQGEKFDPDGDYVRRWVPEIRLLPTTHLFKPWEAPGHVLSEADVHPGKNYPLPAVDHNEARTAALLAFEEIKGRPSSR